MNQNKRLIYEHDWYDEDIIDDEFEDDGSVVYADGHIEKVKTQYDKDMELLEVQL